MHVKDNDFGGYDRKKILLNYYMVTLQFVEVHWLGARCKLQYLSAKLTNTKLTTAFWKLVMVSDSCINLKTLYMKLKMCHKAAKVFCWEAKENYFSSIWTGYTPYTHSSGSNVINHLIQHRIVWIWCRLLWHWNIAVSSIGSHLWIQHLHDMQHNYWSLKNDKHYFIL